MPVAITAGHAYFTHGVLAAAGRHVHGSIEIHTHSFVEIVLVTGGVGTHLSLAGRTPLRVGDAVFLRPGVWHGYEGDRLELFNCGFNAEMLYGELAWTHEDPVLGYLLWTAPLSRGRRGMLTTHLSPPERKDCEDHLRALEELRETSLALHRGDVIARLTLVLGSVARAVAADRDRAGQQDGPIHPVVTRAIQSLEAVAEPSVDAGRAGSRCARVCQPSVPAVQGLDGPAAGHLSGETPRRDRGRDAPPHRSFAHRHRASRRVARPELPCPPLQGSFRAERHRLSSTLRADGAAPERVTHLVRR